MVERWNHLQQRLDLISRWGLLKRAKIENAFVVCRCDAHICKLLTEQDFLITTTPAPLPLFPRSSIFDTGKQRFNLSVSVLGFFFLSFFLKKKKTEKKRQYWKCEAFLAAVHSGNSVHPSERLSVFAQYSWRLVLSQTLCSEARERQKAAGRPAFPHSCPPPSWHPAPTVPI